MTSHSIEIFVYVISALLFVLGLKMLGKTHLAKRGNLLSALGMLLAIVVTLLHQGLDYKWITAGLLTGTLAGIMGARLIAMTRMPEMVALLNGFGGISSLLVGWAVYINTPSLAPLTAITVLLSVLIGGITFTGSIIAWGKLGEFIYSKAVLYTGQRIINSLIVLALIACGILFCLDPANGGLYFTICLSLAGLLGVLSVIPIGGADMPVVISLLNSYSGLAAAAAGFAINNLLLIVAGSLVGASGIILTNIMCKAMNRSLANVLFSGFGAAGSAAKGEKVEGEVKPINADDAFLILEAASSVVIVPGYGLAVAQAQHVVRELGELLENNGAEVKYAIHPVAGRMPGHMNVLLAEANVSYDQLYEMDAVNPTMETADVALVIGANDVVNPAARETESSPIYGMPIIDVDKARTVFVLKRSMAAGFAGIQNALFFKENTRMLFGDAKESVQGLVANFKES
ncbi:NAD(P)(+) transhydrogenase (Re/Si-specific) subunit beta [Fibrobacterota bacterium]